VHGSDSIAMAPHPWLLEDLLEELRNNQDEPKELEKAYQLGRVSFAEVREVCKMKAYDMGNYKNEKGETLIGKESCFYIHTNQSSKAVYEIRSTVSLWNYAKEIYNKGTKKEHETNVIKMFVSIGVKHEQDGDFDPTSSKHTWNLTGYGEPIYKSSEELRFFSQPDTLDKLLHPPVMQSKRSRSRTQEEATHHPKLLEEAIWKCVKNENCDWYHALTFEMAKHTMDYFSRNRTQGQQFYEYYNCVPGDPDSWPTFDILPIRVHTDPSAFEGAIAKTGEYDTGTTMGSYKRLKLSSTEKLAIWQQPKRRDWKW